MTKELPNVYTVMSCYDLENESMKNNIEVLLQEVRDNPDYKHLADKLIFGVDWYLSLITGAPKYKEDVETFYATIKDIDLQLWHKASCVNPARFYGLERQSIVGNMNAALKNNDAKSELRITGYEKMLKLKEYIDQL